MGYLKLKLDGSTLNGQEIRGQVIRLVFHFDSGDNLANNFEGWYVDDIAITRMAKDIPVATSTITNVQQLLTETATSISAIGDLHQRRTRGFCTAAR